MINEIDCGAKCSPNFAILDEFGINKKTWLELKQWMSSIQLYLKGYFFPITYYFIQNYKTDCIKCHLSIRSKQYVTCGKITFNHPSS